MSKYNGTSVARARAGGPPGMIPSTRSLRVITYGMVQTGQKIGLRQAAATNNMTPMRKHCDPLLPELKALQRALYVRFKERGEESNLARFMLRRTSFMPVFQTVCPFQSPFTPYVLYSRPCLASTNVLGLPCPGRASIGNVSRTAKTFDSFSWPCYRRVPVLL